MHKAEVKKTSHRSSLESPHSHKLTTVLDEYISIYASHYVKRFIGQEVKNFQSAMEM